MTSHSTFTLATTTLLAIALGTLIAPAHATPLRLRNSSKRVESTAPYLQPRILVDREGNPLPKPFWKNDHPEGTPHVEVNLFEQVARVYFDGILVGQSPISSGKPGYDTPVGNFTILNKDEDHTSNQYGSWVNAEGKFSGEASATDKAPGGLRYEAAPMPYFIRITDGGVGFHAGYIPGFPASHGCIRMPKEMAEKFFKYLPVDTRVVIIDPNRSAPPQKPET